MKGIQKKITEPTNHQTTTHLYSGAGPGLFSFVSACLGCSGEPQNITKYNKKEIWMGGNGFSCADIGVCVCEILIDDS